MKCPRCKSEDVRRSRRRGPQEGLTLRLKQQAPYRCRACGERFAAEDDAEETAGAGRYLSFADYLGLRGRPRRVFSDQAVLGGLLSFLLLVLLLGFLALAFGWIDPLFLHPNASWHPSSY